MPPEAVPEPAAPLPVARGRLAPIEERQRALEALGWDFSADRYGVLRRLLLPREEEGGSLAFGTGRPGSGKTTLGLVVTRGWIAQGYRAIYRGRRMDAWHRFPGPVKVWADHELALLRVPHATGARPEPWTPENGGPVVHDFRSPADLISRAEPGVLNVVYALEKHPDDTPIYAWDAILHNLLDRPNADWYSLTLDEIHEIWRDRPSNEDGSYARQTKIRDRLADFRKRNLSGVFLTHHPDETDPRFWPKFQFWLYCSGAVPTSRSIVKRRFVADLPLGECIVENGNFSRLRYTRVPNVPFDVLAAPAWEVDRA